MAIKNTNFSSVTLQRVLRSSLQTGTIPVGVTSIGSKYPMNIGDVVLDNPNFEMGPTQHPYYNVVSLNKDFTLQLSGDWSNKLKSGDDIELVRGNIRRDYTIQKTSITTVGGTYSTLTLFSTREKPPMLDPFIGLTGYPSVSADTRILLNRRIENPNDRLQHIKAFDVLMLRTPDNSTFNLKVTWDIDPSVKASRLRWRSVPRNQQTSILTFNLITSGLYSSFPSYKIISDTGRSAQIELHGGVYTVEVDANGTGYTYASAYAVPDFRGGTGASFSVGLSGSSVSTVTVTNVGSDYYSVPSIVIVGDGNGAKAHVSVIEINDIDTVQQGGGYLEAPAVWIDPLFLVGPTAATVLSTLSLENSGRVDYIRVLDGGTGYTGASVSITGSYLADDAIATAIIKDGVITDIKLIHSGQGYTAANVSIMPYGTGGTGASAKANVDIYSEWVYENPMYTEKDVLLNSFKHNVPYEIQILVSTDIGFRGDLRYSSSIPFEYYKR